MGRVDQLPMQLLELKYIRRISTFRAKALRPELLVTPDEGRLRSKRRSNSRLAFARNVEILLIYFQVVASLPKKACSLRISVAFVDCGHTMIYIIKRWHGLHRRGFDNILTASCQQK